MCVMGKFNGKRVLITGAASGIGRIMGAMALEKGAAALVIWDINQANIDATVAEFKAKGSVFGYRVDISDQQQVIAAAQKVKEEVGQIDILINCAFGDFGVDSLLGIILQPGLINRGIAS